MTALSEANHITDLLIKASDRLVRDVDTENLILIIDHWKMRDTIMNYLQSKESTS